MPERNVSIVSAFLGACSLCALFFVAAALHAHASSASLYVAPSAGTFTVGTTFSVSLYVNTGGGAVNAIQADLKFPPDKLQIVSPTTGKSLVQIWVSQPSYSNIAGTLHFQGTVPHPGIMADAGLISTITFRVMQTGTARLQFLDTSRVLLDDGNGTDVLGQTTNGIYTLALPPPAGPIVTSPTEPDQDTWYARKSVVFEWAPEGGAEGYSYLLNQDPIDNPDSISEGLQTSVGYKDLPDGIYYFHIKSLRNGLWGGVTHYKVEIDNAPPAAFTPTVEPNAYTANQTPVMYFETTDAASGVSHYELKLIPLDAPAAEANQTPFFFEASSPYSRHLEYGRYDVIVRAYDQAGNYYQSTLRLTVALPAFQIIRSQGIVLFGGNYTISWPYVFGIGALILLLLTYLVHRAWIWHRQVEEYLRHGAQAHPTVSGKVQLLREKQDEYKGSAGSSALRALGWFLVIVSSVLVMSGMGRSAVADTVSHSPLNPPLITVFPSSVSNNEIPYLGGTVNAPGATVEIYLENVDTGTPLSYAAVADQNGNWFFAFPQFLEPGHYEAWAELKIGETKSPPSPRADFAVSPSPTAIQIGGMRISYQTFYLITTAVFAFVIIALLIGLFYHFFRARKKHHRFMDEVRKVEESLRRGFLLLQHDIEVELSFVKKARMNRELSEAEKEREKKLLRDLNVMREHVGEEVWELGEKGKEDT